MAIFNSKHIDKIIRLVGNTITINTKKDVTYDDWGNEYSNASSNIVTVAIVNDVSGTEEFNTEGVLTQNDKIFFLKSDEVGLTNESTITYDEIEYNIIKLIPYKAENSQQQYEIWAKRI